MLKDRDRILAIEREARLPVGRRVNPMFTSWNWRSRHRVRGKLAVRVVTVGVWMWVWKCGWSVYIVVPSSGR